MPLIERIRCVSAQSIASRVHQNFVSVSESISSSCVSSLKCWTSHYSCLSAHWFTWSNDPRLVFLLWLSDEHSRSFLNCLINPYGCFWALQFSLCFFLLTWIYHALWGSFAMILRWFGNDNFISRVFNESSLEVGQLEMGCTVSGRWFQAKRQEESY